MNEEDLRELKAYKLGYDLGWYRACEALKPMLDDMQDCIGNSPTWRQIERESKEGKDLPLFMARILGIMGEMADMRREHMPTLVLEQKAINDMGERLEKLTQEDWQALGKGENGFKLLGEK